MRGAGLLGLILGAGFLIIIFFGITILYAYLFSRRSRSPMYREFYECGFKAIPDNRVGIDIQYSVLCLIFLIYDMEIIILVPVLVNFTHLPIISVLALFIIFFILICSYIYEWDKYALQWGFN